MNQGARDANRQTWEREMLTKLDRIIGLLEQHIILSDDVAEFTESLSDVKREALNRRGL